MKQIPDHRPPNRCVRCGRPIKQGTIGPVCLRMKNREILTETRAMGYDGKMTKDGVQILIALD